ncbi:hypothetical protein SLS60_004449 [Paraconiothyrium brasiliense]|uniref:NAD(P)-binding protein n=1 Tax=Paraconiothyrium brasiliense TaxID=300254 RepID=A0ABR3RKU8_9PLEO
MPVFLITGAARGIGLELVSQLSSEGSTLVIATVRTISPELQRLSDERENVRIAICDISSLSSISAFSTTLGYILSSGEKITHLLNNAAVVAYPEAKATSMTAEALSENITTNVLGPSKMVEVVLPFLAPDGVIVNITSGMASLQLLATGVIPAAATAYSISKAALNMLTVHQAQELKGKCRVACLDPGHVKTRLGGDRASVEIHESAAGIIAVVRRLDEDKEGDQENGRARFMEFSGKEMPW